MIDIIPNWHPIFVHFTVALLTISAVMFVIESLSPEGAAWRQTCLKFARWNLWLGAGITGITLLAGWQAYNTVAHDTPSHAAMTDHKNWALFTAGFFSLLAVWSFFLRKKLQGNGLFTTLMFAAVIMLGTTAWKGGEVVYRYGLGVMSMPQSDGKGHGHGAAGKIAQGDSHAASGKLSHAASHRSGSDTGHGSGRMVAHDNSHNYGGSNSYGGGYNYGGSRKSTPHSH